MRFSYWRILGVAAAGAMVLASNSASAGAADGGRTWRFKVFLDDKPIGWHSFEMNTAQRTLRSEARYDVRFFFVNAYSYAHHATEEWEAGCLKRVAARTDDNGTVSSLEGRVDGDRFVVATGSKREQLPRCVQSFAYWDPSILSATRLLNAQTGEYLQVDIVRRGREQISVAGKPVPAQAWRIKGRDLQIDLWYSEANEWLALQSPLAGGRILRYEIQ
jgi:hypothetical protein